MSRFVLYWVSRDEQVYIVLIVKRWADLYCIDCQEMGRFVLYWVSRDEQIYIVLIVKR